ncbi:WD40/YVTN repeat-like-containing domain protein [Akanthomyces lecanii RCEF 1005]|uniref:WD40/YVTN repeat-like-containing domain protein n=1 Tax=Akanthomyces lecanii RCEF 1005 TaxID=1081108 RepID=A0A168F628_CORDF|nr:WD40/YVTN repeat-like-containing domain protein [Akanthomyces lecanii RCEF 1005]
MSEKQLLSEGSPLPSVATTSVCATSPNTSIIIQVSGRINTRSSLSRISQLAFSPGGSRLVALSRHPSTVPVANNRRWQNLHVFDAASWETVTLSSYSPSNEYRVRAAEGARALAFGPETVEQQPMPRSSGLFSRKGKDKAVSEAPAVPHVPLVFLHGRQHGSNMESRGDYDLDIDRAQVEIGGAKKGAQTRNVPITEPIAVSPDGTAMIGRSAEDPTEIFIITLPPMAPHPHALGLKIPACVPGHLAKITHLDYMPDGESIVSLGTDGTQRINNISGSSPGQCLHRVRIDTKGYPASLMAISPDGAMVVSVWGRQIVRWYPATDVLLTYDLDEVRVVETWPLAFFANGSFLVCRIESGIDIVRVEDGASVGHLQWTQNGGNYATAAAVSTDGRQMALGLMTGRIMMHELHYVETSTLLDQDKPEEELPAYSKYDD